jgi:biopolymer transport protein ExbD
METSTADIRPAHLEDDEEPLLPRHGLRDEAKFDITAMIDLVFMLNIFFLVTTVTAALAEMDLPVVRHCVATDADTAVIFSLVSDGRELAVLYLGDSGDGEGYTDPDDQTRVVREAVEQGLRSDKRVTVIKAERGVRLKDVRRVGAAAGAVPGIELRLAVIEKE